MTYAAESYAQKTMISLEVRNETVGTVLEKLKKESGFDFFFNNKHVDLKRIVSVSANNNNIFKILDQIFAGTNVKYSVLEKKIIPNNITEAMVSEHLTTRGIPDPDLLIRTGGEKRISNFLMWQLSYAELYFTDVYWPDFREEELYEAVLDYQCRERRFGKTSEQL